METTVRFQGIIADMLGRKSQQVTLADDATVADLIEAITAGDDTATAILKQTRAFINGQQTERTATLTDGAEVIFMRPIAGGSTRKACRARYVVKGRWGGGSTTPRM